MPNLTLKRAAVLGIVGWITGKALYQVTEWMKRRKLKPSEIKFVRNTNKICRGHILAQTICSDDIRKIDPTFECSYSILLWLVEFFDSARATLDIAIYLVTCRAISEAILRAHNRGVKVRIITDFDMSTAARGSAIGTFITNGIPVSRLNKSGMMHRKSAIADNSRLLMGTGNWTMQALTGNWDLWYQTSDPGVLKEFAKEFERQWAQDPAMNATVEESTA